MKIRQGFVSNSSSSSFIVNKKGLSEKKLFIVRNYDRLPEDDCGKAKEWFMEERDDCFVFDTSMDNYDLFQVCREYNIPIDNYR